MASFQYLLKVTEALLDTQNLIEPMAHIVKMEAIKVIKEASKREECIKRFTKTVANSEHEDVSLRAEFPPMDISDDITNRKVY